MKAGWTEVTLGDICEFRYGKALKAADRSGKGFAVYGSNGAVGRHERPLTDGPTIVIGRKGSYGEVHYSDQPVWPIDTTYYVDATATDCDLRWLSYRLRGLGLNVLNRAAAVPGLNREDAYRQRLLLPPPDDQRRLARILDTVSAVTSDAAHAATQSAALGAAEFIESTRAESQHEVATVGALLDIDRGGIRTGPFGSQLLHSEFVEDGISVLGIDNVVTNEFRWSQRRFVSPEKYAMLKRYTVHPDDVLITIMGTCGRVAIVPSDIGVAINTKHLCCITLNQDRCLPEFLRMYFLHHPDAQRYLRARAKGAIMDGLNMGIIKNLPVLLPPIAKQKALARRLRAIDKAREPIVMRSSSLDRLGRALSERAFAGAL